MAVEKSEEVRKWHEILKSFFDKYKDQMSYRQQKVYQHYLIDNYDIIPSSSTCEDDLRDLRDTFDKMECACHDEKDFKGFYSMYTSLIKEWFKMYPQGEYKYLRLHQEWMHNCLNSPKENELLERIASLKKELYDKGIIDERNMMKITEEGDVMGKLIHSCMLARHMIWSMKPYNAETVSSLVGFFYLCEMAQNAYAGTFNYPIYIEQIDESLHAHIADKEKFTRWAHAINGPILEYVGDDKVKWDIVWLFLRHNGFLVPKTSRENAAKLFFEMCPKIGVDNADSLYGIMKYGNGNLVRKDKVFDFSDSPSLKKEMKVLENLV